MGNFKYYKIQKIDHFMDIPHPNYIDNGCIFQGMTLQEPTIGSCFYLHGDTRFSTSPVTEITKEGFRTKNSEYKIILTIPHNEATDKE